MVVANGAPRSGTHALVALLASQGLRRVPGILESWHQGRSCSLRATDAERPEHSLGEALALPHERYVHAHVHAGCRLPGALVVTVFRDPRNVLVSYARWEGVSLAVALRRYFGEGLVSVYRGFLGWRERGLCLRYEDMRVQAVSASDSPTDTYTGAPSDWRERWSPALERLWQQAGGTELVREAGYG